MERPPAGPERRTTAPIAATVGLTLGAFAMLALVMAAPNAFGALAPLVGGLALNVTIVGPILLVRRLVPRLRKRLPPWLPW